MKNSNNNAKASADIQKMYKNHFPTPLQPFSMMIVLFNNVLKKGGLLWLITVMSLSIATLAIIALIQH